MTPLDRKDLNDSKIKAQGIAADQWLPLTPA